jgi:hypothetical protein
MRVLSETPYPTPRVNSFNELQFVIAAVAKFVGVPSTDGEPWKDL